MRFKKAVSLLLVICMIGLLGGCKNSKSDPTSNTEPTKEPVTEKVTEAPVDANTPTPAEEAASDYADEMLITVFDVAANYEGDQIGWYGKILKDKFNIKLNIISPQVAGDQIYQTRASAGELGDIVLLERSDFADCIDNNLVRDITDSISNYPNLMKFKEQIDVYNNGIPNNTSKLTYGIPVQMTNSSPTSFSQDVIYSSPMLRWDQYSELGCPDIADLDGLIDVLAQIQKKHPTNPDGDPAYALSLWPDWDNGDDMMGIANVVQLTTWYGDKLKDSAVLKPDGTFTRATDKTAGYYKMLQFLNHAYQRGIVDPDSGTQKWDDVCSKISAGRVYLLWYSWEVGFWNTTDRLTDGTGFIFIPVQDQNYYADSDTYYGSGRIIGIGSGVDDAKYKRIMDFLDWYASPEGAMLQHDGLEGFNYEVKDGRYYLLNDNALMDNLTVPDEFGGGGYKDGFNAINQWIIDSTSMNPITNEQYDVKYWSTYKEQTMTDMKKAWQAKFDAQEPAEWMKKNGKLIVSPSVSVTLPSDTPDIAIIRSQVYQVFTDYSWKMVFANDDAEFDKLWDEMTEQMEGFDYQTLYEFDTAKWQIQVDAKNEALKNAK